MKPTASSGSTYIGTVTIQKLQKLKHVLQKEYNDWVKKCMEYEVEGARPRSKPKMTWRVIVQKDYQAFKLNRENAMNRSGWRKQIKDD